MITVRIGMPHESALRPLAAAIDRAVREHPLAGELHGLVMIGTGDPYVVEPTDPRPRVVLPLAPPGRLDPLARAQALQADALVFLDKGEVVRVLHDSDWSGPVGVIASSRLQREWELLRGIGVFENASAVDVLRTKEPSRAMLNRFRGGIPDPPIDMDSLVDLILEMSLAARGDIDAACTE